MTKSLDINEARALFGLNKYIKQTVLAETARVSDIGVIGASERDLIALFKDCSVGRVNAKEAPLLLFRSLDLLLDILEVKTERNPLDRTFRVAIAGARVMPFTQDGVVVVGTDEETIPLDEFYIFDVEKACRVKSVKAEVHAVAVELVIEERIMVKV